MSKDVRDWDTKKVHRRIQTAMLVVIAGILGTMLHFQIKNAELNKKRYSSISFDIQSVSYEVEKLREEIQRFESRALSEYDGSNSLLRKVDNILIILKRNIDRPAQLRHNTTLNLEK